MGPFCMHTTHTATEATMYLQIKAPVIALKTGEVVTLDEAAGKQILSRLGTVWVTEEDDRRDHIVGPGEARTVAHGGRTVIQALQPAWISICERSIPCKA
jgi:hypothetical protein